MNYGNNLMRITFDVETTTNNKGHPFDPRNFLVSYSYAVDNGEVSFKYYTDPDFVSCIRGLMQQATLLVGFNIKFDIHWLSRIGVHPNTKCNVFDCTLAEYILSGQTLPYASLDGCLESYGLPKKFDEVAEYWAKGIDTKDIPVNTLETYNNLDVVRTMQLYAKQNELLTPKQRKLVLLSGKDLLGLSYAEQAGVCFNTTGAKRKLEYYTKKLEEVQRELSSYLPQGIPEQCTFNWESGDQLSCLLYGGEIEYEYSIPTQETYKSGEKKGQEYTKNNWQRVMVLFPRIFEPLDQTEVKKTRNKTDVPVRFYQVDDPTLRQLKSRRVAAKRLLSLLSEKAFFAKILETLTSLLKHLDTYGWSDKLHGQFNQNVTKTGRLSSSKPNMQNTSPDIDELLVSRYD